MQDFLIGMLVFTCLGYTTEGVFTSIVDQIERVKTGLGIDWQLPSHPTLWVIPVYALSATVGFMSISALAPTFFDAHWFARGFTYMLGIFATEFCWGFLIERTTGHCPWEYEPSPVAWKRFIKPSFAPLWFVFGFGLEAIHLDVIPRLLT